MKIKFTLLTFIVAFNVTIFSQQTGDFGSYASGRWNNKSCWVRCQTPGTWSDAVAADTFPNDTTVNVFIRKGITIRDTGVAGIAVKGKCAYLTIDSAGGFNMSNNDTNKYVVIYKKLWVKKGASLTISNTSDDVIKLKVRDTLLFEANYNYVGYGFQRTKIGMIKNGGVILGNGMIPSIALSAGKTYRYLASNLKISWGIRRLEGTGTNPTLINEGNIIFENNGTEISAFSFANLNFNSSLLQPNTVTINSAKGLPSTSYNNVTINSSVPNSTGNITINGTLNFTGNYLFEITNYDLILGDTSKLIVQTNKAHIVFNGSGKIIKNATLTDRMNITLPLGNSTDYTPVILSNAVLSAATSSVSVKMIKGIHSLITSADALKRYWTFTTTNLSDINIECKYLDTDILGSVALYTPNYLLFNPLGWNSAATASVNTSTNTLLILDTNNLNGGKDWTLGSSITVPSGKIKVSKQNGNWNATSSWVGGVIPGANDTVYINHMITVTNTPTRIKELHIGSGGIYTTDANNRSRTIDGPVFVNGLFSDGRNQGTDSIKGKLTIFEGGSFIGGNDAIDRLVFLNGIENNGSFTVNNSGCKFVGNNQSLSGTSSMNFNNILNDVVLTNNISGGKLNIFKGGSVAFSGSGKFIQGANSYLYCDQCSNIGINYDFSATENTVELENYDNTIILDSTVFYNLKTGASGGTNRYRYFNKKNDTIHILGNLSLNDNNIRYSADTNQTWIIGGRLTINSTDVQLWNPTNNEGVDLIFTGKDTVFKGTGNFVFKNMTFTNAADKYFVNNSNLSLNTCLLPDTSVSLTNLAGNLFFKGTGYIQIQPTTLVESYTNTKAFINGPGNIFFNKLRIGRHTSNDKIKITMNTDLNVEGNLDFNSGALSYLNLNDKNMTLSGYVTKPGNTTVRFGNSSSTNSRVVLNGTTSTANSVNLPINTSYPFVKTLVCDRNGKNLPLSTLTVVDSLFLTNDTLAVTSLTLSNNATIIRNKGLLLNNPTFSAKVNLIYTDQLTTAKELVTDKIYNLFVDGDATDTITFAVSPIVTDNFINFSGNVKFINASDYIKLTDTASMVFISTLAKTTLPVGSILRYRPIELTISANDDFLFLMIKDSVHKQKQVKQNEYLNFYVSFIPTSTINYSASVTYNDLDIVGTETNLFTHVFDGSIWTKLTSVDAANNLVDVSNLTDFADITALSDTVVSNTTIEGLSIEKIYPNPVLNNVTLAIKNNYKGKIEITIVGMDTKKYFSYNSEKTDDVYSKTINLKELIPGNYLMIIKQGDRKKILKLQKK